MTNGTPVPIPKVLVVDKFGNVCRPLSGKSWRLNMTMRDRVTPVTFGSDGVAEPLKLRVKCKVACAVFAHAQPQEIRDIDVTFSLPRDGAPQESQV